MRYFYNTNMAKANTYTKTTIFILLITGIIYSCSKKAEPFDTPNEEQFSSRYCNDPEAINFNIGFPGVADNSICIYPTEVFDGPYSLKDSILNGEFELDTVLDYTVYFQRISNTELTFNGFCPGGDKVTMTADRYYKASVDSTFLVDSTQLPGQVFCRTTDTISGTIKKDAADSNKIRINLIIYSDTGINYHIGTGVKK